MMGKDLNTPLEMIIPSLWENLWMDIQLYKGRARIIYELCMVLE